MKKLLLFLLFLPICANSQNANDIIDRVTMLQFIVENPNGQLVYRQTKTWCTDFLNFNENQYEAADELYNNQYVNLAVAYKKYSESHSSAALQELIKIIVRQEYFFRQLLNDKQLKEYNLKFEETAANPENPKNKAFNALFISDKLLFDYNEMIAGKD